MSHQAVKANHTHRRHVLILPLIEQYRSKIEAHMKRYEIQPNGCWNWTGRTIGRNDTRSSVYGAVSLNKNTKLFVHRLAFAYHHGIEPGALLVRHSCHNSICVCPDHLSLGTDDDNMRDMAESGIQKGGHAAKFRLKDDQVQQIVDLLPFRSDKELGLMFGVSSVSIRRIRTGKSHSRQTGIRRSAA